MTLLNKLKDKRCRNCKYYNVLYMWCTYKSNSKYRIGMPKISKLICFDRKEVEKDEY